MQEGMTIYNKCPKLHMPTYVLEHSIASRKYIWCPDVAFLWILDSKHVMYVLYPDKVMEDLADREDIKLHGYAKKFL